MEDGGWRLEAPWSIPRPPPFHPVPLDPPLKGLRRSARPLSLRRSTSLILDPPSSIFHPRSAIRHPSSAILHLRSSILSTPLLFPLGACWPPMVQSGVWLVTASGRR